MDAFTDAQTYWTTTRAVNINPKGAPSMVKIENKITITMMRQEPFHSLSVPFAIVRSRKHYQTISLWQPK
jgi:hypothetical protein